MSKLKTYCANNPDGRYDYVVATTSLKKAAELMGITMGSLKRHGGELYSPIAIAMENPGVVYRRRCDIYFSMPEWEVVNP